MWVTIRVCGLSLAACLTVQPPTRRTAGTAGTPPPHCRLASSATSSSDIDSGLQPKVTFCQGGVCVLHHYLVLLASYRCVSSPGGAYRSEVEGVLLLLVEAKLLLLEVVEDANAPLLLEEELEPDADAQEQAAERAPSWSWHLKATLPWHPLSHFFRSSLQYEDSSMTA